MAWHLLCYHLQEGIYDQKGGDVGGIKRRKMKKRLDARVKAYNEHGSNPQAPNNPSNINGRGHDMHKPGGKR